MDFDTIIIGGGAWGCSTAFHLSSISRRRICVLERGYIPYGQSGHTSAIVRQFYSNPSTALLAKLSREFFEDFVGRTGITLRYSKTGMLVVSDEADDIGETVDVMRRQGIECSIIDADMARELEPGMSVSSGETIAYEPDAGFVNPVDATRGFAKAAEGKGVSISQGTDVTSITRASGGWLLRTTRGEMRAENIVIAAGTNSPRLAAMAGLELAVYMLPFPVCYFLRGGNSTSANHVVFDTVNNFYSRPEGTDQILVGAMHSEMSFGDGGSFTLPDEMHWSRNNPDVVGRVDYDTSLAYASGIRARFPALGDMGIYRDMLPFIDITPDWEPFIDSASGRGFDGLFVGCGSSGHGFKLSPMVGRMLAELVDSGKTTQDGRAYRLDRFRVTGADK